MTVIADLHTHSSASDGQYTPTELVHLAKEHGIAVLALTDHDTIDGIDEAIQIGITLGLHVIPGIELGAKEYRQLHILGYNVATGPSQLSTLCERLLGGRDERKYRIIKFLHEKGVDLDLNEVEELAGGGVIARPHFAQVMVRHGFVKTVREAFDCYLDTEEYHQIERFKADSRTCIAAIRAAGGRAVLAHPYQIGLADDALEELVAQLAEDGLEGIECYYPRHTPEQMAYYFQLARRYHLYVTGGSDFHGEQVKPDIQLATLNLELDWLLNTV